MRTAAALACLLLATGAGACGSGDDEPSPSAVLAAASRFQRFTVFHAGLSHAHNRLSSASQGAAPYSHKAVFKHEPTTTSPVWGFIYGDCTPGGDGDHPSCAPPYEVQDYAACARSLHSYAPEAAADRVTHVRGALAAIFGGGAHFERLEIYTRTTTVVIFAPSLRAARGLARELRSADGRVGPRDPLPTAGRGTLANRVACRHG
jgi:hypothetical protein